MHKLSVCITTYNNEATIAACLASVVWADEILVLDSGSEDNTESIAQSFNATVKKQSFVGYGPQKQAAIKACHHNWILLLDADEMLGEEAEHIIRKQLQNPQFSGWEIPRQEQLFWKMNNPYVRHNYYLRLFEKSSIYFDQNPVHASPKSRYKTGRLEIPFFHFAEYSIEAKTERINRYSSLITQWQYNNGKRAHWYHMSLYPLFVFFRSFLFKRNFLNGMAGFIAAVSAGHYAFLRYAKLYEYQQHCKDNLGPWPEHAPKAKTEKEYKQYK